MGYLDDRVDELQDEYDDLTAGDELRQTNELLSEVVDLLRQEQGLDTGTRYYTPGVSTAGLDSATTEDSGADRVHWGEKVSIGADDIKDDPARISFPFKAHLIDLRGFSNTIYLASRDPTDVADSTVWFEVEGGEAPISELPVAAGEVWLATDQGVTASPRIDAWLHGL